VQLQILIAELDNVKAQLAARKELQLEKAELEQRLRDAEENFSKLAATKDHPTAYQELQLENRALERRLRDAEENCNTFEKELQETNMELGGLKQNLEEAEQIELQNEALVTRLQSMSEELAGTENLQERLKANESDTITKDKLVRFDREVGIAFLFDILFCSDLFYVVGICPSYVCFIFAIFIHTLVTQHGVGIGRGQNRAF